MRDDIGMPGPCGAEDHRDELPLLLHGTLTPARRAALEAHLAVCAECAADLALLRRADRAMRGATPAIDVAAIAAGVRAATRTGAAIGATASTTEPPNSAPAGGSATPAERAPALQVVRGDAPPVSARGTTRPSRRSWYSAWPARVAATLLVTAMGTGALVLGRARTTTPVGEAPVAVEPSPVGGAAAAPSDTPTIVVAERDASPAAERVDRGARTTAARAVPGGSLGVALDDLSEEEVGAVLDALDEPGAWRPVAEPLPMVPTPGEEGGL